MEALRPDRQLKDAGSCRHCPFTQFSPKLEDVNDVEEVMKSGVGQTGYSKN